MGIVSKILAGLTAVMGMVVLFLRGSLAEEKAKRKQEELERARALQRGLYKASAVLIKGMEDVDKTDANRDHDFTRD